jgi:hypothetical protein
VVTLVGRVQRGSKCSSATSPQAMMTTAQSDQTWVVASQAMMTSAQLDQTWAVASQSWRNDRM